MAADPAVEAELDRLPTTALVVLRARYQELFRTEPPKAFGPDLLRRSIAQRIQEKAYGGLSRPAQRLLDHVMKAYTAKPGGALALPRQIKPGSVLVRNWKGKSHRVTVTANGFAYEGETFSNLSEIASLVTGTRWNGPRFFGLRTKTDQTDGPAAASVRLNGGSRKTVPASSGTSRLGGGSDYRKRNAAIAAGRVSKGGSHGR